MVQTAAGKLPEGAHRGNLVVSGHCLWYVLWVYRTCVGFRAVGRGMPGGTGLSEACSRSLPGLRFPNHLKGLLSDVMAVFSDHPGLLLSLPLQVLPSSSRIWVKSSTRVTTSSLLFGYWDFTQVLTSPGRMLKNCSRTSSSRICSFEWISGLSHLRQSSRSWFNAFRGPARSGYGKFLKFCRQVSVSRRSLEARVSFSALRGPLWALSGFHIRRTWARDELVVLLLGENMATQESQPGNSLYFSRSEPNAWSRMLEPQRHLPRAAAARGRTEAR